MKRPSMKLIVLGMFTAAIASCVGCSSVNKAYWDHKVDELCDKDGGVTFFEKVQISKSEYPGIKLTLSGRVLLLDEDKTDLSNPFFIRWERQMIHDDDLKVSRVVTSIIRAGDNTVLSTLVAYTRSGGDPSMLSSFAMPSHYSCENTARDFELFQSTITVK